jgi:hypothetical protein
MTWNLSPDCHGPTPEQLAAFADGELGPAERARVEAWLAGHPTDAREVESLRRLVGLWRDNPPPEPSFAAWDEARERIAGRAVASSAPARGPWRRWPVRLVAGLLTAAALVGGVLLARAWWPAGPPEPAPEGPGGGLVVGPQPAPQLAGDDDPNTPFPVATAGEVNVLSIDAQDADAVILHPPLMGEFELAEPADILVLEVQPAPDGGIEARLQPGPVPMIVVVAGTEATP